MKLSLFLLVSVFSYVACHNFQQPCGRHEVLIRHCPDRCQEKCEALRRLSPRCNENPNCQQFNCACQGGFCRNANRQCVRVEQFERNKRHRYRCGQFYWC